VVDRVYKVNDYAEPLSREALRRLREWPKSDQPWRPHMLAKEYYRLQYLLRRYCRGEVDGVSVLLTGQRGAGKTTLAKLAVEGVMRDSGHLIPLPVYLHGPTVIDPNARAKLPEDSEGGDTAKSVKPAAAQPGNTSIAAIIAALPPQNGEAVPSEAATSPAGAGAKKDNDNNSDKSKGPGGNAKPTPEEITKEQARIKDGAFRVILTELYRCLSRAISEAWLNALDESPDARRRRHELLELRAHLDVTLDRPTDVEALRALWERAGFLNSGVAFYLTPATSTSKVRYDFIPSIAGDARDQGLREILALSACADTFNVILGKPKEKVRRAESAERERQYNMKVLTPQKEGAKSGEESKGAAKSAVEKVAPAALGILAGSLAFTGSKEGGATALGLAVGLVVWLASFVSISYNFRRQVSKKLDRELELEVDWSPERIERDLPILIKRVKDAGFAPIFIVDELDKLSNPTKELDNFIHLAKHIVTDYAAFLFLTDRAYYEELLGSEAPPAAIGGPIPDKKGGGDTPPPQDTTVEKNDQKSNDQRAEDFYDSYARTFYTHRIFLNYTPDDYRNHLFRIVDDQSLGAENRRRNELGLLAWGTILVYRSRMVPAYFSRRLITLLDDEGNFSDDYQDPSLPLNRYQNEIMMQLAVEAVASRPEVQERIREVPIYGQYAYDTLYYLSYLHEQGRAQKVGARGSVMEFKVTPESLREYLRYRAEDGSTRVSAFSTRYQLLTNEMIEFLFERVLREYIVVLSDPGRYVVEHLNVHISKLRRQKDAKNQNENPDLWSDLRLAIDQRPLVIF